MTVTHFAGINTARLAAATEGHPILISYADILRRPGVWERELLPRLEQGVWPSVILDSGAFTVISTPKFHVDIDAYVAFAAKYKHLFSFIVNLDDIAGDVAVSKANHAKLSAAGVGAIPVFHQGESWDVLEDLLQRHSHIGFGFARKVGGKLAFGRNENGAYLKEFFARTFGRAVVHGFACTYWANNGFDFDSVDSTSWIAEYRALSARQGADEPRKSHSVSGLLARILDRFDADDKLALTLGSYATTSVVASSSGREYFKNIIERDSRGQARTVFRRYDPSVLRRVLAQLTFK